MIRLVRFLGLAGFLLLILAGCDKNSGKPVCLDAAVCVKVTDKLGKPVSNVEVGIYTASLFHTFQSDVTIAPYLSVMTDNNGELNFKFEQEKWFVKSKTTELYFVVIQYLSPQNYHYWSAGGTGKAGENRKFTIVIDDYMEIFESHSDFEIKDGILLKYTGATDDTIVLPDGVREIAANCFAQSNIRQIVLNEGMEVIGDFAFYKSSVEQLNFPSTLKVIGKHAFEDCNFLKKADLSKTALKTISASTFWGCGIVELKFPECLEKIEAQAFLGTTCLKKIVVPYATIIIGNEAFRESGIESVQLSNNILSLGDRAFYACEQLRQVTSEGVVGNNKGVVEVGCFENCSHLEQVALPLNIVELMGWTFIECHKLISLAVPPRVAVIGYHGLNGSAIKYITFQGEEPPRMKNSLPAYEDVEIIFVPRGALQDYKDKYPYYAEKMKAIV